MPKGENIRKMFPDIGFRVEKGVFQDMVLKAQLTKVKINKELKTAELHQTPKLPSKVMTCQNPWGRT